MQTRTRLLLIAGTVTVIAGVAAALLVLRGEEPTGPALGEAKAAVSAEAAELPPVADPDRTVDYMIATGAPLLRIHSVAVAHVEARAYESEMCIRDATELAANLPMTVAISLITDVPDDALRGLLDAERTALAAVLAKCDDLDAAPAADSMAVQELHRTTALVDLRMDEIGVQR